MKARHSTMTIKFLERMRLKLLGKLPSRRKCKTCGHITSKHRCDSCGAPEHK